MLEKGDFMGNKKTKIILIVTSIFIVLCFILIVLSIKSNSSVNKNNNLSICSSISKFIEDGKPVIIFYDYEDNNKESIDESIKSLKSDYKLENVYRVSPSSNDECKKYINNNEELKSMSNKESFVALYKDKSFVGYITTAFDYNLVIDYLDEKKFIEKKVIKETTSLEGVKDKIKKDKYIVFVVGDESNKNDALSIMKNYNEYDYDIISLDTTVGENIYIYLSSNYKISNELPQFIYFKNGKVSGNGLIEKDIFNSIVK